jgi:hypothetical protein
MHLPIVVLQWPLVHWQSTLQAAQLATFPEVDPVQLPLQS